MVGAGPDSIERSPRSTLSQLRRSQSFLVRWFFPTTAANTLAWIVAPVRSTGIDSFERSPRSAPVGPGVVLRVVFRPPFDGEVVLDGVDRQRPAPSVHSLIMSTQFQTIRLRQGTADFLRHAAPIIQRSFGLERPPAYTALIVAGIRSLYLLSDQLRLAPFGDARKLSTWLALVDGVELPQSLDRSLPEADVEALLTVDPESVEMAAAQERIA